MPASRRDEDDAVDGGVDTFEAPEAPGAIVEATAGRSGYATALPRLFDDLWRASASKPHSRPNEFRLIFAAGTKRARLRGGGSLGRDETGSSSRRRTAGAVLSFAGMRRIARSDRGARRGYSERGRSRGADEDRAAARAKALLRRYYAVLFFKLAVATRKKAVPPRAVSAPREAWKAPDALPSTRVLWGASLRGIGSRRDPRRRRGAAASLVDGPRL